MSRASASPFFIELRNPTTAPVSTAGYKLEVTGSITGSDSLPTVTVPAGGLVHYTNTQLGFRPADGDKLILRSPTGVPIDVRAADLVTRGRRPPADRDQDEQAADHQQARQQVRRMAEIGVHHPADVGAGGGQALDHRGAEAKLAGAVDDADAKASGQFIGQSARAIG